MTDGPAASPALTAEIAAAIASGAGRVLGSGYQASVHVYRTSVGAVVVKDYGRLIGILTERDMLKAMAERVHTSEARVRQWMTEDPITASLDTDVEDAARTMLENGFRHLPVTDETGRVVGIASLRRVAAAQAAADRV